MTRILLDLVDYDSSEFGPLVHLRVTTDGHEVVWDLGETCSGYDGCDGGGVYRSHGGLHERRCLRCDGDGYHQRNESFEYSIKSLWMVFDEAHDALALKQLDLTDEERAAVAAHEDNLARELTRASRANQVLRPS